MKDTEPLDLASKMSSGKKTVFSFSVYGNVNKYVGGLLENCKDINRLYPEFWIYVYLGNDFDQSIITNNFSGIRNLKLIQTNYSGHKCMVQRFITIDDADVSVSFSRDCDSRINERDQYCINTFLASNKKFQIIRDHIAHDTEILGGLWGIRKGLLPYNIRVLLEEYETNFDVCNFWSDQLFLRRCIYPLVKDDCIIFDPYRHYTVETVHEIPVPYKEVYGCRDHAGFIHMPVNLNNPFGEHGPRYEI